MQGSWNNKPQLQDKPSGVPKKGVSTGRGLLSLLWNGVVEEELTDVDGYTMGYLDSVS